jgi:hypothetical protein
MYSCSSSSSAVVVVAAAAVAAAAAAKRGQLKAILYISNSEVLQVDISISTCFLVAYRLYFVAFFGRFVKRGVQNHDKRQKS